MNTWDLVAGDSAALRCEKYETPLTLLLSKPASVPSPANFFQAWPSLAHGKPQIQNPELFSPESHHRQY